MSLTSQSFTIWIQDLGSCHQNLHQHADFLWAMTIHGSTSFRGKKHHNLSKRIKAQNSCNSKNWNTQLFEHSTCYFVGSQKHVTTELKPFPRSLRLFWGPNHFTLRNSRDSEDSPTKKWVKVMGTQGVTQILDGQLMWTTVWPTSDVGISLRFQLVMSDPRKAFVFASLRNFWPKNPIEKPWKKPISSKGWIMDQGPASEKQPQQPVPQGFPHGTLWGTEHGHKLKAVPWP